MNWTAIKMVFSWIWVWLQPVVLTMLNNVTQEILEFATKTITELVSTDLSNEDKRAVAFDKIKQYAKEGGKDLSSSLINTIIEIVYQRIRN